MKIHYTLLLLFAFSCKEKKDFAAGIQAGNAAPAAPTQGPTVSPTVGPPASPPVVSKDQTKTFELKSRLAPIDMVWVLDNSGSMGEEIAKVKKNFAKFMTSIGGRSDVRLTLISTMSGSTGMVLDAASLAKGHQQINAVVGSSNAIFVLASAICPLTESNAKISYIPPLSFTFNDKVRFKTLIDSFNDRPEDYTYRFPVLKGTICSQNFVENTVIKTPQIFEEYQTVDFEPFRLELLLGKLSTRLRADAKKVFVFVTDDDASRGIVSANFFKATKQDPAETSIYAFAGIQEKAAMATAGCSISKRGTAYEALAKQTGGSVFDICQDDWSQSFDDLAENIATLAQTNFKLETTGSIKVNKVTLDGTVLTPAQFRTSGTTLILLDQAISKTSGKLVVSYAVQ